MTGLYRAGKRLFSLELDGWRKKRRTGRLMRYYIKPADDGRNRLARRIDFYGTLMVTMLLTLLFIQGAVGNPVKALIYALPLWAVEVIIANVIKTRKKNIYILHRRIWLAGKEALAKIQGMTSPDQFTELVRQIMCGLPYCSDVHAVRAEDLERRDISLRAVCNGIPVVINTDLPGGDSKETGPEQVLSFIGEIERSGLRSGIMISTGEFSEEAGSVALETGKGYAIRLVNVVKLVELARQAGHEIFSVEGSKPEQMKVAPGHLNRKRMFREALSGRKKGISYLTASVIMAALYLAFNMGSYNTMYLAFALFNLALALYCLWTAGEKELLDQLETIGSRN
ncbi:MAG: hypothetical protein VR69_09995 [Peptococcaceae bacterium BRH_c4b]|nr:MAG: hypothetical protein VR69_09995 [Peptococcaceae bacterium BRH_c4b]